MARNKKGGGSFVVCPPGPSPWPSPKERGNTPKSKSPNHVLSETMVRAVRSLSMFSKSADKHLLVSIRAVNGTWRRRHQDFQAASQAGQNRGQLARRLDHFRLDELSRVHHAFVRGVDGATDKLNFLARHIGGFVGDHHQSAHFFLNQSRGFRQVHRRRREMPGHHVELLGYLPTLNGNRGSLLAERSGPAYQRQRNDRGDHYQPEEWFVWIHLKRGASCLVLNA